MVRSSLVCDRKSDWPLLCLPRWTSGWSQLEWKRRQSPCGGTGRILEKTLRSPTLSWAALCHAASEVSSGNHLETCPLRRPESAALAADSALARDRGLRFRRLPNDSMRGSWQTDSSPDGFRLFDHQNILIGLGVSQDGRTPCALIVDPLKSD